MFQLQNMHDKTQASLHRTVFFQYKRMLMGVLAAPGQFQHVFNSVLDASDMDIASAFLDDIMVGRMEANWRQGCNATLKVMRTLARFSFMLNLQKCKLLVSNAAVLGFELWKQGYILGQKYMRSQASDVLPRFKFSTKHP